MSEDESGTVDGPPGHAALLRLVVAFQFKLFADGLRDVLLSPVSIGSAILGAITRPNDPTFYFRRLMAFGLKSDRWINLFGAHGQKTGERTSDELLQNVETLVTREYKKRAKPADDTRPRD